MELVVDVVDVVVSTSTQLAQDKLGEQSSPGIEQIEVVTVEAHELPLDVSMGMVVSSAELEICVRVGKSSEVVGVEVGVEVTVLKVVESGAFMAKLRHESVCGSY